MLSKVDLSFLSLLELLGPKNHAQACAGEKGYSIDILCFVRHNQSWPHILPCFVLFLFLFVLFYFQLLKNVKSTRESKIRSLNEIYSPLSAM